MSLTQDVSRRLSGFMKKNGFSRKGKCFYKIQNNIAFCIESQLPGDLMYTSFYIMPLYMPTDVRYLTYGKRMGELNVMCLRELQKDSDEEEIGQWINSFCATMEAVILPFFECVSSPSLLLEYIETHQSSFQDYLAAPPVHIYRLIAFTELYLGRPVRALEAIELWKQDLTINRKMYRFILDDYESEIRSILHLIGDCRDLQLHYFDEVITSSCRSCFNIG